MQKFEAMAKNEEEKAMQALVCGGGIEVDQEYWNAFGKILSKKIESQTVRLTEMRVRYNPTLTEANVSAHVALLQAGSLSGELVGAV